MTDPLEAGSADSNPMFVSEGEWVLLGLADAALSKAPKPAVRGPQQSASR
jgi:hypothetical protein